MYLPVSESVIDFEYLKNNIGASKRQAILDLNTEEQDD